MGGISGLNSSSNLAYLSPLTTMISISWIFFQEIANQRTFFGALAFIENYARTNKITIPNACKIGERDSFKGVERKNFGATLTMN